MRRLCLAPALLAFAACHPESHAEPAPTAAPVAPVAAPSDPAAAPTAPPVVARTLAGSAPGTVMDIRAGDAVQGRLEDGDQVLADQSLGDDYALMLTEGHPITVVVRAGASADSDGGLLDPQLVLLFNDREVAADDDGARDGAAGNSRIVFSPPVSGLYVLRVTTSGSGVHHGAYALQAYPGGLLRQR